MDTRDCGRRVVSVGPKLPGRPRGTSRSGRRPAPTWRAAP
jgi:hypothetical protein